MTIRNHPCGCITGPDPECGIVRNLRRCSHHHAASGKGGREYYEDLGVLRDGIIVRGLHLEQMEDALGESPSTDSGESCLEIGPGVSPYCAALIRDGWRYVGFESDPWAADWLQNTYLVQVHRGTFPPTCRLVPDVGLILAAHVLEHSTDAPRFLATCGRLLTPGGELRLIVPDDADLLNPDHNWFFTEEVLIRSVCEFAGLEVVRTTVARHVPHERFIYLKGVKPEVVLDAR